MPPDRAAPGSPGETARVSRASASGRGLAALLAGAAGIGFAPIFVRLSETGPSATAFWRIALAMPLLGAWAILEKPRSGAPPGRGNAGWMGLAGLFFAGDLALWHWSIRLTSVANATLFANFASLFIVAFSWLFLREKISRNFLLAMALALAGTALLVGANLRFSTRTLAGDGFGVATAGFYAGYLLSVKALRGRCSTAAIMAGSALVSAPVLVAIALLSRERFFPETGRGWLVAVALAVISQALGQSLIAYALAHLRASFSSVALLVQPVVAAAAAWQLLGEKLAPWQMLGGVLVLAAVAWARIEQARGSEGETPG